MKKSSGPLDWSLKSLDRNFLDILIPAVRNSEYRSHGLAISDLHLDSLKSDRKWLKNVFDQVIDRRGFIMIFGDILDLMQAKGDPRHDKRELNPKYVVPGHMYFDLVIEDVVEFLLPYRTNLALISPGNHESNIEKRGEWDPISMIVRDLKRGGNCNVQRGGYSGNVRFSFSTDRGQKDGIRRFSYLDAAYHHGSGIKSKTSVLKYAQENKDCRILISGHFHEEETKPLYNLSLSPEGKRTKKRVHVIRLGSAKDDKGDGYEGYAVEKSHALTMPSAHWLEFYYDRVVEIFDVEPRIARFV